MAHRGAHGRAGGGAGENTAAAVRAAARLGYAWVETDVRATADGVAVLAHDADLVRTAGHDAVIAATTLADLVALAPATTTLAQACAAAPVHLNIDVKDARAIPDMVALATAHPHLVARWRLASFSETRRRAAVAALAAVPGTQRVRSSASAPLAALCWALAHAPAPRAARGAALSLVARAAGIDCLQLPPTATLRPPRPRLPRLPRPPRLPRSSGDRRSRTVVVVDAALLDAAHRAGLEVHVWTVDDPDQMQRLLDAGADAVITDDAPAAAAVLAARGAWSPSAPPAAGDQDGDAAGEEEAR